MDFIFTVLCFWCGRTTDDKLNTRSRAIGMLSRAMDEGRIKSAALEQAADLLR